MNYETTIASSGMGSEFYDENMAARRRRQIIIAIVVAAVVVIAALFFLKGAKDGAAADSGAAASPAPIVTVISPGESTVQRTVDATGSLASRIEMPVASVGEGGEVLSVLVQPGDWVRAGQTLAVIERSVQAEQIKSMAASVEVARADARIAQSELDRAKALVARGFISQADIDRKTATRDAANARVNVAVAQLGEQRARTGRLDIRAPAAGLVLTRGVEPGQVVTAGSGTLFRIAKGGEMEMLAQMSEADLARVRVGNPATVTPVGSSDKFEGHVWQVAPVVDPQTRQGIARIALSFNKAIRPGGFASASIISGAGQAPLLPESAVQSDPKGNYVFIVNASNQVERRDVTVGQVSDQGVAITGGLSGREKIVASAGAFLSPGQKVKPELQKAAP